MKQHTSIEHQAARCAPPTGERPLATGLTGRQHLALGLVFLLALVLRGVHAWGQARNNPFFYAPAMDEEVNHQWAQRVASGAGLGPTAFFRAPLHSYLLGGLYALFGPNLALARTLGALLGAVTCYLLARLGVILGGFATGLIAGLIAAVYWPLIHFDSQLLTTGLEGFFNVLLLLLLLCAARRDSLVLFGLAGVAWGLAALTRPNVLAFAPGLLLWLWMARRRAPRPLRWVRAAALLFAGAVVTILPVTIRNYVVAKEWVLIAAYGGVNFYIGNNPQADGCMAIVPGTRATWWGGFEDTHRIAEHDRGRKLTEGEVSSYWLHKGLAWIGAHPGAWLRLMLEKVRLFWSPIEIPNNQPDWYFAGLSGISVVFVIGFPIVGCLALAGLALLVRDWRAWSLPIFCGALYMATVVLFFCPGRYRLPAVPMLILLAAGGLARLPGLCQKRRLTSLAGYGLVGGLAALFLATNPPDRVTARQGAEGLAHHNLAMYYAQVGRQQPAELAKVIPHLEEAARFRPYDPQIQRELGQWLAWAQRPEEAAERFTRALALAPNDVDTCLALGDWLASTGQASEAIRHYENALRAGPQRVEPRVRLGIALAKIGRAAAAEEYLRAALEQDPTQVPANRALARIEWQRGDKDAALARLRQAALGAPADATLAMDLVGLLDACAADDARDGQFDRAVQAIEEALQAARRTNQSVLVEQLENALRTYKTRAAGQTGP